MFRKVLKLVGIISIVIVFGVIVGSSMTFADEPVDDDDPGGSNSNEPSGDPSDPGNSGGSGDSNTVQSSASANASVTVTSACSFTVNRGSGYNQETGSYEATLANGATVPIIGSTFTTTCNDAGGYAIYAVGYSNNTFGNTDLIFNNTPNSTNNIKTNGDTLVGGNGSSWKMSLTATTTNKPAIDNSFSTPQYIPSTYTKVASYNAVTVNDAGTAISGQPVTVTYQATASNTQPAGTYTGAVKYTMVHPGTMVAGNYTIVYNANGGSGTMQSETGIPNYESHTLADNTFTAPSGYAFAGWCTAQDTTASGVVQGADPQTTCTSTSYANGATLPDSPSTAATANGTLNLYAYWTRVYTMQQFAAGQAGTTCSAMNINDTLTLLDVRDSQAYTVAKLADEKCWMTKNLNLPGNILLSSDTTDFDSSYALPTDQGWQSDGKLPASSTSGFDTDNYAYIYNSNSETCGDDSPCYSYYSWDAATLGSGRNLYIDNRNAPYSICPKGWHLPSTYNGTNSSTDLRALIIAYGGSDTIQIYGSSTIPTGATMYEAIKANTVPNFIITGYYHNNTFYYPGGNYWSSTSYGSSRYARALLFSSTVISVADIDERSFGFSVRCLTE